METMEKAHSHDACYFGEHGHWLIAYGRHRDSDILSISNFESMKKALKELPEFTDWENVNAPVTIERSTHWAVGWIDYLIVNPEAKEIVAHAEKLRASLEDYPVLDDNDFSNREYEAFGESWNDWGREDYTRELWKAILAEYSEGISEEFSDEELHEVFEDFSSEEIDEFQALASENVNWLYESEDSGVRINIKGLVEKTDTDKLTDKLIEGAREMQETREIQRVGKHLGACPAEIQNAIRIRIKTISGYQQLMQGSI